MEQTKKKSRFTKKEWYWIIYDVGNSAFTMVSVSLFALFFGILTDQAGLDQTLSDSIWSYAASAVTLGAVLFGPIIGSVSDYKGLKKPLFLIMTLGGILGCIALGFPMHYVAWLVIFVVCKICYNGALMIYDSMLVDVTTEENSDKVSSYGYALGYIGSCIPFLIGIAIVALGFRSYNPATGAMDAAEASMSNSLACPIGYLICFAINALWWLGFTIPLYKVYEQKYYISRVDENGNKRSALWAVGNTYKGLWKNLKYVASNKGILLYLLSFFFYIDAVYSIIELAIKVSESLGVDQVQALIALIAVQFIAFPSAIAVSILSKKYGNTKMILACIIAYICVTAFAVFIVDTWMFWVLAVFIGLFQGGIQSLSRSYFTQIIPKNKSGELFGLFDVFGKGASFIGTLFFGIINQNAGSVTIGSLTLQSANLGIIPLFALAVIGGILFVFAVRANIKAKPELDRLNREIEEEIAEGDVVKDVTIDSEQ